MVNAKRCEIKLLDKPIKCSEFRDGGIATRHWGTNRYVSICFNQTASF